jgi:hypothetical protein
MGTSFKRRLKKTTKSLHFFIHMVEYSGEKIIKYRKFKKKVDSRSHCSGLEWQNTCLVSQKKPEELV